MKKNAPLRFLGHFIILALTVVVFLFSKNMPLLATLGFESGTLLAAIFGPFYFMAAASQSSPNSQANFNTKFVKIGAFLICHFLLLISLLLFNGFFSASCSDSAGLIPFLVAIFPPLLLNVALGVLVASLVNRPAYGILITIAFYCGYYALVAYSWWQEPTFRILTHFSLLIESDLLQGANLPAPVYAYRLATLLFAASVLILGSKFLSTAQNKMFTMPTQKPVLNIFAISATFFVALFLHASSMSALGKTHSDMAAAYSLRLENNHIIVRADPKLTSVVEAQKILDEALYFQNKIAQELGQLSPTPLSIWLHQNYEQKFLYTGAKNVHFALPKHREIHIANTQVPHDVLGHELAHIFVGEFSKTLIGLPGQAFIIPNMALTEGLAMVLSNELNLENDLTMLEQAKALHHANITVDIRELFAINPKAFALSHPRSSYIYSGAFLEFLVKDLPLEQRRKDLLTLISQGDMASIFNQPTEYDDAIMRFEHYLTGDIAPYAVAWAQKTYSRYSILGRDCKKTFTTEKNQVAIGVLNQDPHKVKMALDAMPNSLEKNLLLSQAIDSLLTKENYQAALELIDYAEPTFALENLAQDASLHLAKFNSLFHLGQRKSAQDVLWRMNEKNLSPFETRLTQVLGAFLTADLLTDERKNLYSAGISALLAKNGNTRAQVANFSYQLGREKAPQNSSIELANLLAHYIYARIKMSYGKDEDMLAEVLYLQSSLEKLPPRIQLECQKMQAQGYMNLGQKATALEAFRQLRGLPLSPADRVYAASMADRMAFALTLPN